MVEGGRWALQTSIVPFAAKSGLDSGLLSVDPKKMISDYFLNFLKVSPQLPQRIDSWGCFPTELKDSFPSVGMDAGLQLRHGLSYGH